MKNFRVTVVLLALGLVLPTLGWSEEEVDLSFDLGNVRRLACTARNGQGLVFEELGTYAPDTQDRAMAKCFRSGSSRCYPHGCRIVYLRPGD